MVISSCILPEWPPRVSTDAQDALVGAAMDFALGNGLVLRPKAAGSSVDATSVVHGPFTLFPTPFPRDLFEHAVSLQPAYNTLYAHVTSDEAFLRRVIGGAVSRVDAFQGELWRIWETVRNEGLKQDLTLGLFRSDYMLHEVEGGSLTLQQVEFNTISSSFGSLACKTGDLHSTQLKLGYLAGSNHYPSVPLLVDSSLPANEAIEGLVDGLAAAFDHYRAPAAHGTPRVLVMVVQDTERNAFDQRHLEWDLLKRRGIKTVRLTFSEIGQQGILSERHELRVPTQGGTAIAAVVYFRAGYTPNDYPSHKEWETRLLIERSNAIKCPSVALQLAGAKKVQQVLSEEGASEAFSERGSSALSMEDIRRLRSTYTNLYPLDDSPLGKEALKRAKTNSSGFVLKPQREGGGNNIYREAIPPFLEHLEREDAQKSEGTARAREGYILMDLIQPPPLKNVMCPAGSGQAVEGEIISELGIYGVCLFRTPGGPGRGAEVLLNKQVGHLLRTKAQTESEGGVATGYSVLDSPVLVD